MKIALGKIYSSISMLSKIKEMKLGIKVDYWCVKNIRMLSDDYRFFLEKRDEVYAKYCNKGEDGLFFKLEGDQITFNIKDESEVENFDKELNELMTNECEIEPYVMSMEIFDTLPNVNIEGYDIYMIDYMLPL